MPDKKRLIVTTSGKRSLSDIKKDLAREGFDVGHVLKEIGVITGSAPAAAVKKLRAIAGVDDISADEPVDIGPPDAPVQ